MFCLILVLAFLAGGFDLTYQLLWIRSVSVLSGSTLTAVSTVSAAAFCGLALGSWLGSRMADRHRWPLSTFALCKMMTAGAALLTPCLFSSITELPCSELTELFLLSLVLFLFSTPMGALFPLLCTFCGQQRKANKMAWLYGMNTLGSCLGAFLTGCVLLRFLGMNATLSVTAPTDILLNFAVLLFSRKLPQQVVLRKSLPLLRLPFSSLVAAACSGFLYLGWELFYLRYSGLFFRDSTQTYALIIGSVILASGCGDIVFGSILRSFSPRFLCLFGVLFGIATASGSILLASWNIAYLTALDGVFWRSAMATFLLIGMPTFFFSAIMPSLFALSSEEYSAAETGGQLMAFNTVGTVTAALVFPFLIFPEKGLASAFFLLATMSFFTLFILLKGAFCHLCGFVSLATLAIALINPQFFFALPQNILQAKLQVDLKELAPYATLEEVREGRYGTAWIARMPYGERLLFENNVVISREFSAAFRTEGFLPLFYGTSLPGSVLSLCFGGGLSTLGPSLLPEAKHFDLVDISKENVALALKYFKDSSSWLTDKRARFHTEDALRFLRKKKCIYELILAEPTPPHYGRKGAVFYTTEFFLLVKKHLAPGGVFSMPLPTGQLSLWETVSIMHTFAEVFPSCLLLWNGCDPLMVGSNAPLSLKEQRLKTLRRNTEFTQRLAQVSGGMALHTEESLAAALLFTDEDFRRYASIGKTYTLDFPELEFSSEGGKNFSALISLFQNASSPEEVQKVCDSIMFSPTFWNKGFLARRARLVNTSAAMAQQ